MKTVLKITFIAILGLGFSNLALAEKNQSIAKKPKFQTDTFSVTHMSCHKDANLVERGLYRLKGVKKVSIDGENVVVKYDTKKTNAAAIKNRIEGTGSCESPDEKLHKAKKR